MSTKSRAHSRTAEPALRLGASGRGPLTTPWRIGAQTKLGDRLTSCISSQNTITQSIAHAAVVKTKNSRTESGLKAFAVRPLMFDCISHEIPSGVKWPTEQ